MAELGPWQRPVAKILRVGVILRKGRSDANGSRKRSRRKTESRHDTRHAKCAPVSEKEILRLSRGKERRRLSGRSAGLRKIALALEPPACVRKTATPAPSPALS